jgi:hypothetical protein
MILHSLSDLFTSDFVCINGSPKFCLVPSGYGSMVLAGSAQFFLILSFCVYGCSVPLSE